MAPHATFDEELARAGLAKARDKDLAEGLRKEFISMEAELEHERNERERQARDQPGLAGGGLFGFGRGWSEESGGLFNFNHMMKKIIDNVQVTIKNVHIRFEDLWDASGAAPARSPREDDSSRLHDARRRLEEKECALGLTLRQLEVKPAAGMPGMQQRD